MRCVCFLLPLGFALLSGCASQPEGEIMDRLVVAEAAVQETGASVPALNAAYSDIQGRIWLLSEVRINSGKMELDRAKMAKEDKGDMYVLQLTDEGINGKAAPNRYFAPFEMREGHEYRLGPIAGTLMASIVPINIGGLMENEYYWYLQRTTHWEAAEQTLELTARPSPDEEIILRYVLQQP
jgi:heat shock protein HslJ